jgi:putative membrane-bound dehydrogenase-like protein
MKTKKRNTRSSWLAAAIALLFHGIHGLSIGNAQDPALHVERFPALPLEEAQAAIELVPGYSVELVASEPMVTSPVAIQFDPQGAMWVVEMVDYSEQETDALGRISRLEDRDHDGRMDHADVIAEKISWPTAIAWVRGGVWVAAPPHVLKVAPTRGPSTKPGVSWTAEPILSGLGRQNVQGMANSFRWGLDGKLHLSTSSNGGQLLLPAGSPLLASNPKLADSPLGVQGRDIGIGADDGTLQTFVGYGQHGMDMSPWGDRFVCSNSDHLQQVVAWYLPELTDASLSKGVSWRRSIAIDGPQAEVYRISPVESWRLIRTQMRLSGASSGLLEGGGRASGYFTSATGITIYDGDQWAEDQLAQPNSMLAFIADVGSNLVHRKRLRPNGPAFLGERIDNGTEFLRSRDTWFRPVQFANGPDGCLYIVDMARETIEHPKSLPEPIKSQVDLTSGRERGRIWRVRATERPIRREGVDLLSLPKESLVQLLGHPNGWHRKMASQLLLERREELEDVIPALREMVRDGNPAIAQIHALSVLARMDGKLDADTWLRALQSTEPSVRLWGLVFTPRPTRWTPDVVAMGMRLLQNESDPNVRIAACVRAGQLIADPTQRAELLVSWIRGDLKIDESRAAVEYACRGETARHVWEKMKSRFSEPRIQGLASNWIDGLLYQMHLNGDLAKEIQKWNPEQTDRSSLQILSAVVPSIGRLLERRSIAAGTESFQAIQVLAQQRISRNLAVLVDTNASESQYIELLGKNRDERQGWMRIAATFSNDEKQVLLKGILKACPSMEIQIDAIEAWAGNDVSLQRLSMEQINEVPPLVGQAILRALIRNETGAALLLSTLEQGRFESAQVPAWVWQTLRSFPSESIRKQIETWDKISEVSWESIADGYRAGWKEPGSKENGLALFQKWCASCHRIHNVGIEIGPSLESYRVRPNEAIGLAVAEPSREMDSKYEQHQIRTQDGRVIVGILMSANQDSIVLRTAQNETVSVARSDVDQWKTIGKSLMPDGLMKELSPEAFNDLIAFLRTGGN